jgi:hypothetical protein
MDQSKLNFLQNVLRYSTSHSDGTEPSAPREMSPEVILMKVFIIKIYFSIILNL